MRKSITSITDLMILLVISLPITFATELNLTYDANGNLISGDGKYRQYNSLNQLVTIYNGTNSSGLLLETYQYHPTEERILAKKAYNSTGGVKETTIYSSKSLVRTINSSGTFDTTYIYQNGQLVVQRLSDGTKQYIHTDHLGSATIVTNELGQQIENTSYTPFGEIVTGGSTTRFDYEGKESDSLTGDTDFHFRKYLPQLGIFAQPDALIANSFNPRTLNRYTFELNNPYKYVDLTGKEPTRSEAGEYMQVVNYIQKIENACPSCNAYQTLALVGVGFGSGTSTEAAPSYIYTEQAGVIDQRHFFVNAMLAQGINPHTLLLINAVFENLQGIYSPWSHSAFTYEDISSDKLGMVFLKSLNSEDLLSEQYAEFMRSLRAGKFPLTLWMMMPDFEKKGERPEDWKVNKNLNNLMGLPTRDANLIRLSGLIGRWQRELQSCVSTEDCKRIQGNIDRANTQLGKI